MTSTDLFKPYLWLAAVGFAVGFVSYVAAAQPPQTGVTLDLPASWTSTASAPASGDWNFPKEI